MAPYKEWQNAEYGRLGVQDFTELRVMHAPHGKTCAAMATPGNASGSPYPRKMIRIIPDGSGGVAGGAAYGGIKNRSAIRDGGRRAVMDPKSDATSKGFNARAEMPGFGGERPRTLCSMLHIKNSRERILRHGEVRRGGAGPQAAHAGRRTAVNAHLPLYANMATWPSHEG